MRQLPWLSNLPKHWHTKPFRYLGDFQGGGTPSKEEEAYWVGDIPWVSPKDMKSDFIADSQDHITERAIVASATRILPANSVMLVVRSGILQHSIPVAINSVDVALNQDMKGLVPARGVVASYYRHFIAGWQDRLLFEWRKPGATVESLDSDRMLGTDLPMPPTLEQQAIADFLDRKTAAIDALIAKKERLIELLQEKRQALITQAVTKGLDPSAPMKDSGIEWLGQIPAHWRILPLKALFSFSKGRNSQELTATYVGDHQGPHPVYSGQTKHGGVMGRIDSFMYELPDVLFTTTVGARVMTAKVVSGRFSLSQNCLIMIPRRSDISVGFFNQQLKPLFRYERASIPDHMQPSLRISDLQKFSVAVPPFKEQASILNMLEAQSTRTLLEKTQASLKLLREYRQALITEAVTGKLNIPVPEAA